MEFEKLCENIKNMVPLKDSVEDMLAEKDIIKSYSNLDGIDWQGLLESNYLEKNL